MRKRRRKSNYMTIFVFVTIISLSVMGIGYSYLQESLNMNITITKKANPVTASEIAVHAKSSVNTLNISQAENSLIAPMTDYVFQGIDPNNYVSLYEREYRIVKIVNYQANNETTKMVLVSTSPYTGIYTYTQLREALESNLGKLGTSDYVLKSQFDTGVLDNESVQTGEDMVASMKGASVSLKAGLLTPLDYIRASSSSTCQMNSDSGDSLMTFSQVIQNCNQSNYLDAFKSGATFIKNRKEQYYLVNGETIAVSENSNIYPVIVVSNHLKYMGTGEKNDPYVALTAD